MAVVLNNFVGEIPVSIYSYQSANATGTLTAGGINIVSAPSIDLLNINDLVFAAFHVEGTKGSTAGDILTRIEKASGTGVINWIHNDTSCVRGFTAHPANQPGRFFGTYIGRVITSGTYVARLWGSSAGSNFSLTVGSLAIATLAP